MVNSYKYTAAALVALAASSSFAQSERLPDLGAGGSAFDINESRQIAGLVVEPETLQVLPAIWSGGSLTLLPRGPFEYGFANGVSSNGNVAGAMNAPVGAGTEPVAWIGGELKILPTLGEGGSAVDVNANGDVVGEVILNGQRLPALWRLGVLSVLPVPAFGEAGDQIWTTARSINNSGVIIGTAKVAFGSDSRALRWTNGVLDPLPLNGFLEPRGAAITTNGRVLFDGYDATGSTRLSGIISPAGEVSLLSRDESAISTRALALNDAGSAAGYVRRATAENYPIFQPVVWEGGVRRELELKAPNIWAFTYGINDAGDVVGQVSDGKSSFSEATLWPASPNITAFGAVGVPGGQASLSARVMRGTRPVAGQVVRFSLSGQNLGQVVSDSQGWARLRHSIPANAVPMRRDYMASLGGSKYSRGVLTINRAQMAVTALAAAASGLPGQRIVIRGLLTNASLNRPAGSQPVTFQAPSGSTGLTTASNGTYTATVTIPATAGRGSTIRVTVRFAGNPGHTAASATAAIRVN